MKRYIWTALGFVCAIVFISLGVKNNEHIDVLNKAVKICLECIGIG